MKLRSARPIHALVLTLLVALVAACGTGGEDVGPAGAEGEVATDGAAPPTVEPEVIAPADGDAVTLYFPGRGAMLYAEERVVKKAGTTRERVEQIVAAVLAGPQNAVLKAPLADETKLLSVQIDPEGRIAWIDLGGGEGIENGGSRRELLAIYSLVNSVVENVAEVDRVSLLRNGSQRETFAGHIDVTHPLTSSPRWVAR